jgi:hypothetical protein
MLEPREESARAHRLHKQEISSRPPTTAGKTRSSIQMCHLQRLVMNYYAWVFHRGTHRPQI